MQNSTTTPALARLPLFRNPTAIAITTPVNVSAETSGSGSRVNSDDVHVDWIQSEDLTVSVSDDPAHTDRVCITITVYVILWIVCLFV